MAIRITHNQLPPGWDEERVRRVLAHYENQPDDEAVAEDELAFRGEARTIIEVPAELLPVIRGLIELLPHPTKPAPAKSKSSTKAKKPRTYKTVEAQ